jgi:hypothetical protein
MAKNELGLIRGKGVLLHDDDNSYVFLGYTDEELERIFDCDTDQEMLLEAMIVLYGDWFDRF